MVEENNWREINGKNRWQRTLVKTGNTQRKEENKNKERRVCGPRTKEWLLRPIFISVLKEHMFPSLPAAFSHFLENVMLSEKH